jgi:hypothetical protein
MFVVSPYKIGTKVRIGLGPHRGKEGRILERRSVVVGQPQYAAPGNGPQAWPGADTLTWEYRVELLRTGEQVDASHISLEALQETEREEVVPDSRQ